MKRFFKKLIKPFTTNSRTDQNEAGLEKTAAQEQTQFSFETLVAATKNFRSSLIGGFGSVYKGKFKDGREIAVKRLYWASNVNEREFETESNLLARVSHRNVVKLLGYCVHHDHKLLVYEYVANESLDKVLFNSDKKEALNWERRYDVILGIAKGLLHLHEEAIIHSGIKAGNILLDDNWIPKIGDFGMARLYPRESALTVLLTWYDAPEYHFTGCPSAKADVYSFGVVVLELVSGQKYSSFKRTPDLHNLLDWAYELYKQQRSLEFLDPMLASSADPDQVSLCLQIGLLCVQLNPEIRPDSRRLVEILARKLSIPEKPLRPGTSGSRHRRHRK